MIQFEQHADSESYLTAPRGLTCLNSKESDAKNRRDLDFLGIHDIVDQVFKIQGFSWKHISARDKPHMFNLFKLLKRTFDVFHSSGQPNFSWIDSEFHVLTRFQFISWNGMQSWLPQKECVAYYSHGLEFKLKSNTMFTVHMYTAISIFALKFCHDLLELF